MNGDFEEICINTAIDTISATIASKHGFAESELFQYFGVFMSSVRSN
jgi:hypothetical protein